MKKGKMVLLGEGLFGIYAWYQNPVAVGLGRLWDGPGADVEDFKDLRGKSIVGKNVRLYAEVLPEKKR